MRSPLPVPYIDPQETTKPFDKYRPRDFEPMLRNFESFQYNEASATKDILYITLYRHNLGVLNTYMKKNYTRTLEADDFFRIIQNNKHNGDGYNVATHAALTKEELRDLIGFMISIKSAPSAKAIMLLIKRNRFFPTILQEHNLETEFFDPELWQYNPAGLVELNKKLTDNTIQPDIARCLRLLENNPQSVQTTENAIVPSNQIEIPEIPQAPSQKELQQELTNMLDDPTALEKFGVDVMRLAEQIESAGLRVQTINTDSRAFIKITKFRRLYKEGKELYLLGVEAQASQQAQTKEPEQKLKNKTFLKRAANFVSRKKSPAKTQNPEESLETYLIQASETLLKAARTLENTVPLLDKVEETYNNKGIAQGKIARAYAWLSGTLKEYQNAASHVLEREKAKHPADEFGLMPLSVEILESGVDLLGDAAKQAMLSANKYAVIGTTSLNNKEAFKRFNKLHRVELIGSTGDILHLMDALKTSHFLEVMDETLQEVSADSAQIITDQLNQQFQTIELTCEKTEQMLIKMVKAPDGKENHATATKSSKTAFKKNDSTAQHKVG